MWIQRVCCRRDQETERLALSGVAFQKSLDKACALRVVGGALLSDPELVEEESKDATKQSRLHFGTMIRSQ